MPTENNPLEHQLLELMLDEVQQTTGTSAEQSGLVESPPRAEARAIRELTYLMRDEAVKDPTSEKDQADILLKRMSSAVKIIMVSVRKYVKACQNMPTRKNSRRYH